MRKKSRGLRLEAMSCFSILIFTMTLVLHSIPSWASDRLRVGVRQVDADTKLVLIGVAAKKDNYTSDLNFEDLGFEGKGMDHLDPKFLFQVEPEGITEVRSFELEEFPDEALPPLLLNSPHAKREKASHFLRVIATGAGKSLGFPIAMAASGTGLHFKSKENLRKLRAYYLLEILNQAFPPYNRFQDLKTALSNNPEEAEKMLRILGENLLIRFNPNSNFSGIIIQRKGDGDFYRQWRLMRNAKQTENRSYLIRNAEIAGLKTIPIENSFTYILLDSKKSLPDFSKIDFMKLGSSPEDLQRTLNNHNPKSGRYIPWFLVSNVHADGPVDLVNFLDPKKFAAELYEINRGTFHRDLAGSVIPLSNWLIKGIHHQTKETALSDQDTQYVNRLMGYGSALALTETHSYRPLDRHLIAYSYLIEAVETFGYSYELSIDQKAKRRSRVLNDLTAILAQEEERGGRAVEAIPSEEFLRQKYDQWLQLKHALSPSSDKTSGKTPGKASRSPCSLPSSLSEQAPSSTSTERKPIILILLDGARPDRILKAIREGLMPNLKTLFYDKGIHLDSYSTRALTLPSWSTILTGYEPDMHGIRSNTPTSRVEERVRDDFQDPRKDLLNIAHPFKNRAFRRIEEDKVGENGKIWLPDYYQKGQVFMNFMPISHGNKAASLQLVGDFLTHAPHYINGTRSTTDALDVASAKMTVKAIENDRRNQLRLVINWYVSIDEASHYNNYLLPTIYKELDEKAIGPILAAAKNHPVLKDATVFLISDHGHTGGFRPFDDLPAVYGLDIAPRSTEGPLLVNTSFHLTRFLAGEYEGYEGYHFTIGTAASPDPKFDHRLTQKIQLQPFHFTYPENQGKPNALVDCAGDNFAQIYIKGNDTWDRLNYYELSHFRTTENRTLNLPKDFLQIKLKNLMISDHELRKEIIHRSHHHPVQLFAMPLPGKLALETANGFKGSLDLAHATREPILVIGRGKDSDHPKTGLILTRSDSHGNDLFRYVVVKNFSQTAAGRIDGLVSMDPSDDPLRYLGKIKTDGKPFLAWRTDREWLNLTRRERLPTAIFSLARSLTLPPKFTDPHLNLVSEEVKKARNSEIPDFALVSNPGFGFHSDFPLESDHGGLLREEVHNSFFVSSLNPSQFDHFIDLDMPILNRDFMPTILEFAGLGQPGFEPLPHTQGKSHKSEIEAALLESPEPSAF